MTIMIIRTTTIGGVGLIIGTIAIGGVGLAKMESWTEGVEIWDWRVGEEHVYTEIANCPAVFLSFFSLWICCETQLTNTKIKLYKTLRRA